MGLLAAAGRSLCEGCAQGCSIFYGQIELVFGNLLEKGPTVHFGNKGCFGACCSHLCRCHSCLGSLWLSWKSKRASCQWGYQKSLAISCDSCLGIFWAAAKIAERFPWEKGSEIHQRRDMQRCWQSCAAVHVSCVWLGHTGQCWGLQDAMLLQGLRVKNLGRPQPEIRRREKEKGQQALLAPCAEPYLLLTSCASLQLPTFTLKVEVSLHGEQLQLQRSCWWPGLGVCGEERE